MTNEDMKEIMRRNYLLINAAQIKCIYKGRHRNYYNENH